MDKNNSANDSAKKEEKTVWLLVESDKTDEGYAWVFTDKEKAYLEMCKLVASYAKTATEYPDNIISGYCKIYVTDDFASICVLDKDDKTIKDSKRSWRIYEDKIR